MQLLMVFVLLTYEELHSIVYRTLLSIFELASKNVQATPLLGMYLPAHTTYRERISLAHFAPY